MNNQARGCETGPLEACFLYKTEVKNNIADKSKFYVYSVEDRRCQLAQNGKQFGSKPNLFYCAVVQS